MVWNFQDDKENYLSGWNEFTLSEGPAIKLLEKLGYTYVSPTVLESERERLQNPVVEPRLRKAIKRINPWISEENILRVLNKITRVPGNSGLEINQKVHEHLVGYLSVTQEIDGERSSKTVKIIDFENVDNNEFIVTNQYRVVGPKKEIRCDVVCLINGLPIVVIEAKNPTSSKGSIEEAVKQLQRYQSSERGAPALFYYTHVLIPINRVQAMVGTNDTPPQHYLEWKDPYPKLLEEVEAFVSRKPNTQDIALVGVLTPENLLDIIQNFVVYEVADGKTQKKIPRYQQYRAVNKAIKRIVQNWGTNDKEQIKKRGGVIWHTQGSGKSLTMLFLATKLRRVNLLQNPTVLVVTDRINLDKQITNTFRRCNFPSPISAKSTSHLQKLVKEIDQVPGRTILTTIHKFQEKNRAVPYPELASSANVIVLADEAHRTQYKGLAMNMRTALPNATFIAFTGTPLIKAENITTSTFSNYIDKYSINQSVQDKATVPIFYEGRLPNLHVEKQAMDLMLEIELESYSDKEQEQIKRKYANIRSVIGAESRIKTVAVDIYKHFRKFIHPNGFKGQIVAINRITSVRYKKILDELLRGSGIECAVVYSPSQNDSGDLLKYQLTHDQEEKVVSRFKDPNDPLALLIVVDKLLTGFDAPIEQVMYLDNVLKAHNLLQAIARVNRTYKNKEYGLIVDYVGISNYLKKALAVFDEVDLENALIPFSEAHEKLKIAHNSVMELFQSLRERENIDACADHLADSDQVELFVSRVKEFENAMDMVLPDPIANEYKHDLVFAIKLLEYLKHTGRSETPTDLSDISQKIKDLIDEHVRAQGVQLIVQPISILSDDFDKEVEKLSPSSKGRALIIQSSIQMHIKEKREKNPVFYDELSARLQKIIEEYEARRLSEAEFIDGLHTIIEQIENLSRAANKLGLDESEYAFYKTLNSTVHGGNNDDDLDAAVRDLTMELVRELEDLAIIDWQTKDDILRKMRQTIKLKLRGVISDRKQMESLTTDLIEVARRNL